MYWHVAKWMVVGVVAISMCRCIDVFQLDVCRGCVEGVVIILKLHLSVCPYSQDFADHTRSHVDPEAFCCEI